MRIHMVGVSGTGMGSLALLFRAQGHTVTGSDASFDPPMGPALKDGGVECLTGYDSAHLTPRPDLVIVGNAIRRENPEATFVREQGLRAESMSRALRDMFLVHHRPFVVTGTHGKTTTSSMCAFVLSKAGLTPGWFIGGIPKNFPSGAGLGETKRKLASSTGHVGRPGEKTPFVVEGDEYDAVYWHKKPKFLDYVGASDSDVVLLTSIEHDHVDIYPTAESYEREFVEMIEKIPENGLLVVDARDVRARELSKKCRARVVYYALDGDDTGDVTPTWLGAFVAPDSPVAQPFDLYAGGVSCGRTTLRVPGAHNIRNAVGTLAACCEGFGVSISDARAAIAQFDGVKRRQDLVGTPGGVFVYDDFAHHPTAVDETLRALRARHKQGTLFCVFEPRSATACRALHQKEYATAFGAADRVLLAPLGRTNLPADDRLDVERLAREIGGKARAASGVDDIVATLVADAKASDVIAIFSNGAFGGIHGKLTAALGAKS